MAETRSRLRDWLKFALGLAALLGFAWLLASGVTPPGAAGEVLRHNQAQGIDATALFYTELEE